MDWMIEVEQRIARQHLLRHPFYEAWTAGTLPRAALVDYVRQYYAFERSLPRFLTAMHSRADDARLRAALLSNAWDEEHGEHNHAELWLRFAEALGVPRADVTRAEMHAATSALVDSYWDAATRAPVEAGVAALYAYESQLPAVAEAKIAGLVKHYGITGSDGLAFFEVHQATDVEHAAAERRILEEAREDEGKAVVAAAGRALDAWWSFLDASLQA